MTVAIHPSARIAETARIAEGAELGADVEVGHFCIIEDEVSIGPRSRLEPHVVVKRWTTLGSDNQVSTGAVLGTDPLDKNFSGERSYLAIGNGNRIREHFTISRGTDPESTTVIGDANYIMTSGHIAHNCRIGSENVICSGALIAGHAEIEDRVFISGGVLVHQHSKIGRLALISGHTRVHQDTAPYFIYSDFKIRPRAVNVVGLRRAGFDCGQVRRLKRAFHILFRSGSSIEAALTRIEMEILDEHTRHLVEFVRRSERGICRR